ncbi:hypothetical protein E4U49_006808, partial [Claviceps purpurea]
GPGTFEKTVLRRRLARRLMEDSLKAVNQSLIPPQCWYLSQHASDFNVEVLVDTRR